MDYVMRRRSTVGGALEMFSLPLPLHRRNRVSSPKSSQNRESSYRLWRLAVQYMQRQFCMSVRPSVTLLICSHQTSPGCRLVREMSITWLTPLILRFLATSNLCTENFWKSLSKIFEALVQAAISHALGRPRPIVPQRCRLSTCASMSTKIGFSLPELFPKD